MSKPPYTSEYLLLIRGTQWEDHLSPDEVQHFMTKFTSWFDSMNERGILKGSQPLAIEGKIVSGSGGGAVADGPFAESKETIAGYFLLQVDSIDEAIEIAKAAPMVEYGSTIEVRPVIERCATMQRAGDMAASASE